MAIIGISLIVASVVLFCLRPPAWLPNLFANLTQRRLSGPAPRPPIDQAPQQDEQEDEEPSAEEANVPRSEKDAVISPPPSPSPLSSPSPPTILVEEPVVEIEVTATDAPDMDVESHGSQSDDWPEQIGTSNEVLHDEDAKEEEDEEYEEQPTPKAIAPTMDASPVPSLLLSEPSGTTELSEDNAPQQMPPAPPSFTMTPLLTFNTEPAASLEPVAERGMAVAPEQALPSITMEPPPAYAMASHAERETGVVAHSRSQPPPPQFNLVAPEQTPTVLPSQLYANTDAIATATPPRKTASELMPPPPVPSFRLPKPRTSGIPLPASSSSPVRRIPSLTAAGRSSPTPSRLSSPTPSRLPSPPTAPRNISPTTSRIAKPSAPPSTPSPPAPPTGNRIPTLNGIPRRTSPTPGARNLPLPRRGGAGAGPSSSSGLMPPPTATSIPKKPSRQVSLQPGHSPLDWARLAQSPTSDLRNLPANTPYLRVTPSLLKQHNGRKGNDAWSAFGGKVYNITPYIAFHPGGGPELLRGAGKDGTRLFAEVHPWVNYETMLQSCLIGILVDETEAGPGAMEEMD